MEEIEKPKKKYSVKTRAKTYDKNPFMEANYQIATRTKRLTNNRGGLMVKSDSGEVVHQIAGFWHAEEVDSTKFVKLFVNGVKAFSNLTPKGAKVFELMYYEMQKTINKDKIYLNIQAMETDIVKISKTTFYDGIAELVDKKFIAPVANMTHWFFINPDYVWNGDRLSFVKTYIKQQESTAKKRDENTMDLPFEDTEKNNNNQGEI